MDWTEFDILRFLICLIGVIILIAQFFFYHMLRDSITHEVLDCLCKQKTGLEKRMNLNHNNCLAYIHRSFTEFGEKGEVGPPSTVKVNKKLKGHSYFPSKDPDVIGKGDLVDEWE